MQRVGPIDFFGYATTDWIVLQKPPANENSYEQTASLSEIYG